MLNDSFLSLLRGAEKRLVTLQKHPRMQISKVILRIS